MQATPDRRVRAGAKSCTECRRRKIRCVWLESKISCTPCDKHDRTCTPQVVSERKLRTSKARINHLEETVSSLKAELQFSTTASSYNNPQLSPTRPSDVQDLQSRDEHPPAHLKLLFDTIAEPEPKARYTKSAPSSHELCRLIPSIEEVSKLPLYASKWMSLYYDLFPSSSGIQSGEQLLRNYSNSQSPVETAHYLILIAITVQQAPWTHFGGQPVFDYVTNVIQVVQQTIIDSELIMTPNGLDAAMLFIRLSLGRGNLKQTWLTLRKIIAIAEMIDLDGKDSLLWQAICVTDRNFSMMLNLPPGTTRYNLEWTVDSPQAYNYALSNICAMVFEIDKLWASESARSYEQVLRAHRLLKELPPLPGIDLTSSLVKFWHQYILARVHFRPTMVRSTDYMYSQQICLEACRKATASFPQFRQKIPAGFFVCRILDLQVLTTATIILLLDKTSVLIDQVIECLRLVSNRAGSDFGSKAIEALALLQQINTGVEQSQTSVEVPLIGRVTLTRPQGDCESPQGSVIVDEIPWSFYFEDDSWLNGLMPDANMMVLS